MRIVIRLVLNRLQCPIWFKNNMPLFLVPVSRVFNAKNGHAGLDPASFRISALATMTTAETYLKLGF